MICKQIERLYKHDGGFIVIKEIITATKTPTTSHSGPQLSLSLKNKDTVVINYNSIADRDLSYDVLVNLCEKYHANN